ncbi:hypothetical protein PMAYCL1PPCAC_09952, partial [Pristionchus mayeri]
FAMQLASASRSRPQERPRCGNCNKYGHYTTQCTAIANVESQTANEEKDTSPLLSATLFCCGSPLFIGFCWSALDPDSCGGTILAVIAALATNAMLRVKDKETTIIEQLSGSLTDHKRRFKMFVITVLLMYIDIYVIYRVALFNRHFVIIPVIVQCLLYFALVILHSPMREMCGPANVILTIVSIFSMMSFPFIIKHPGHALTENQEHAEWQTMKFALLGSFILFFYFSSCCCCCEENDEWKVECEAVEAEARRRYVASDRRDGSVWGRQEPLTSSRTTAPAASTSSASIAAPIPVAAIPTKTCQTAYSLRTAPVLPVTVPSVAPARPARSQRPPAPVRSLSLDSFHSCASTFSKDAPNENSLLWPD